MKTASKLFNIDPNYVNEDQRRRAKIINFGLLYGMSGFGLAKQLQCSQEEAKEFCNKNKKSKLKKRNEK